MQRRSANGRPVKSQRTKKPATARKSSADPFSTDHPQDQLVERLRRERDEAIELQAASAEVLKIIGSSPRDMKPVFEAMLVNALRICGAKFGHILLYDGERFHATHLYDVPPSYRAFWDQHGPIRPSPKTGLSRLARTKQVVHIPDLKADPTYTEREPLRVVTVEQAGARSFLAVPMLEENKLVGAIVIYRMEVRPFSVKQIELVKNFAAQAVIAMENARLVAETREALEQQTATAEVLRVINSSPGNLAPVFEAILEKAHGLCHVTYGSLQLYDGNEFRAVAVHGLSEAFAERLRQGYVPGPNHQSRRLMEGERFAHTPDMGEIDDPISRAAFEHSGIRTALFIPLRKEARLIGQIVAARREVRPFNQKEIALLENFAAQAVIAMENARLFNETKEALERQTATADILKVIASSPSDVQPVFDAIATSSNRLIGGFSTAVLRFVDDALHLAAFTPTNAVADEALEASFPRPLAEFPPFVLVRDGETNQFTDTESDDVPPLLRDLARLRGYRSMLFTPLMNNGMPIGMISVTRKEPGPFAAHHIELVRTFADQAVIAIENARLFEQVQARTRDLSEALQQQTATADVLKVISRSAFDLQTVFDTLIMSAVELSGAFNGTICLRDGDRYRYLATAGIRGDFRKFLLEHPPTPGRSSAAARVLLSGNVESIPDVLDDPDYDVPAYELNKTRSVLGVPLLRDDKVEGALVLARIEPGQFTTRHVELVQTFADQAVIAIENARLFEQVQARTKELAASLDDLRTAQDRLVQTEKLASLGQLTAGIAHEIKNPLNFVNNFSALSAELVGEMSDALAKMSLDTAMREELDELAQMLKGNLEKVVHHGKRADSIVKNMLQHSREGSGEHRPADINAIVDESLNLAYHGARAENARFSITLQRDLDPSVGMADIYPQEITRVLLNLISNGFYATTKRKVEVGDGFEPMLSAATKNLGDKVEIRIRDNGTGIPEDAKDKIFNPFFTTKPSGEGTGLGLSMSHDIIVKQHGGSIDVETEPGLFTEFKIVLPRTSQR
jgi:two-component system NtrC family sensor kinase